MRDCLWKPGLDRKYKTNMFQFMQIVNARTNANYQEYHELYNWSITNIPEFWQIFWEFADIKASKPYNKVVDNFHDMFNSTWFDGTKLNFAENLLRYRDEKTAVIFKGEDKITKKTTYAELYDKVTRLSHSLRCMGVTAGDRIAGFMPNMTETIIAMLAATSIGAIWSSCSPDFGFQGVMDRLGQIQPKVLFTANGYYYNGREFDSLKKVSQLIGKITSIERVVVVPYTQRNPDISMVKSGVIFDEFLAWEEDLVLQFEQLPFEYPLYILFSSGTTGVPKCIVHGVGGTLIQHLKELILHTDLTRNDTIFYFTTCGWMMWNWLVSSLAVGATLVLYDGSPFYPDAGALFKIAEKEKITIFGTSAKYLSGIERLGLKPRQEYDLGELKSILSTGSPLAVESFQYVYREIKEDVCLSSISGGTDIISCFALGNPIGPVYEGELQCRGLGMKVEAYNADGGSVIGEKGELVCTAPFPSMPIYFWNDQGNRKYYETYFDAYKGLWTHRDYVEVTPNGGMIIYGRSDATLNPAGVRIGTAEVYRQVELLAEVVDSLVVGQDWDHDLRVILFVKLKEGIELTQELIVKIQQKIRENTTPRHVPSKIIKVDDIPYTISGKKVELAVKKVIQGEQVLNKDALANPKVLDLFRDLPELRT